MKTSSKKSSTKGKDTTGKKRMKRDPILDSDDEEEDKSIVYVGHLPKEFEERDLKVFLGQFGKVQRCRLSRSLKTGNPRGFGFAKFTDAAVAGIVAETLNGYFVGKRRLVCHVVAGSDIRPGLFFDTDRAIERRKLRKEKSDQQRHRNLASASKLKEITSRLLSREKAKRAKFAELGIEYDFPGYQSNTVKGDDEDDEMEESTPSSKNKRKDSIGSEAASDSMKKAKRKDSISSETSESSKKKHKKKSSKRKELIGSETSLPSIDVGEKDEEETPSSKKKRNDSVTSETSESSKKKKKKSSKRKDSIDSQSSASKRERKNSVSSETSESSKKKKRKDCVGSESSTKGQDRKDSEGSLPEIDVDSPIADKAEKGVQSEKKKKKKSKKSKRHSL